MKHVSWRRSVQQIRKLRVHTFSKRASTEERLQAIACKLKKLEQIFRVAGTRQQKLYLWSTLDNEDAILMVNTSFNVLRLTIESPLYFAPSLH